MLNWDDIRQALLHTDGQKKLKAAEKKHLCCKSLGGGGYWPNEVGMASEFIEKICEGNQSILIISPMQSGKTGIIACITGLLRATIPSIKAVFIIANDQIDLRAQNAQRLQHIHGLEILSRRGRRIWEKESDVPYVIFYDENHFGDGTHQTVHEYLLKCGLKNAPNVIYCGVSATPFTSVGCLDGEVWPDIPEMEKRNYNSVSMMKQRERIKEATPLFMKADGEDVINKKCATYMHIEKILRRRPLGGYCIIRASYKEAKLLQDDLESRFGEDVYVQHWNMGRKDFSPKDFFADPPGGVFSIVFVQQKARMGNTIDTRHMRFFYENFGTTSTADTILQSLVGRACGFGKCDDTGLIYTRLAVVDAYDVFCRSRGREIYLNEFAKMLEKQKIKLATRASECAQRLPEFKVKLVAEKTFKAGACRQSNFRKWIKEIRGENKDILSSNFAVRTLSHTQRESTNDKVEVRRFRRSAFHPRGVDSSYFCNREPGSGSAIIYDKYPARLKKTLEQAGVVKDWEGCIVKIFVRISQKHHRLSSTVFAAHTSFHRSIQEIKTQIPL